MPEQAMTCKFCGSTNIWKAGFNIKSDPYRKVQRYQCKDCGKHFDEDQTQQKEETTDE